MWKKKGDIYCLAHGFPLRGILARIVRAYRPGSVGVGAIVVGPFGEIIAEWDPAGGGWGNCEMGRGLKNLLSMQLSMDGDELYSEAEECLYGVGRILPCFRASHKKIGYLLLGEYNIPVARWVEGELEVLSDESDRKGIDEFRNFCEADWPG